MTPRPWILLAKEHELQKKTTGEANFNRILDLSPAYGVPPLAGIDFP